MTGQQIELVLSATPFRPFEMLLADQRVILIEQPDLIVLIGDGSLVVVYRKPAETEIIDLTLVVSLRFQVPGLFDDPVIET